MTGDDPGFSSKQEASNRRHNHTQSAGGTPYSVVCTYSDVVQHLRKLLPRKVAVAHLRVSETIGRMTEVVDPKARIRLEAQVEYVLLRLGVEAEKPR